MAFLLEVVPLALVALFGGMVWCCCSQAEDTRMQRLQLVLIFGSLGVAALLIPAVGSFAREGRAIPSLIVLGVVVGFPLLLTARTRVEGERRLRLLLLGEGALIAMFLGPWLLQ